MDLFEQISNDIKEAMKAKDKVKLETLRNVKKFFLEAKTAPGANDTLTDDAALKIMQQLSAEELEAKLKEIIERTGAKDGKDMGKVMGVASKELAGLAEGRAISAKVKELLG